MTKSDDKPIAMRNRRTKLPRTPRTVIWEMSMPSATAMPRTIADWMRERATLCKTLAETTVPRPTGVLSALLRKPNLRSKTTDMPLNADVNRMMKANIPHARNEK